MSMTQDCVEWNDDSQVDLRHYVSGTPASARKGKDSGYSPGQEIENIWNLLETKNSSPTRDAKKILQRSNSCPLSNNPHRRRKRPRLVETPSKHRKRRKPTTADSTNHAPDDTRQVTAAAKPGPLGFEDLLKQLDTPGKKRQPLQVVARETVSTRKRNQQQKVDVKAALASNKGNKKSAFTSHMPPPSVQDSIVHSLPLMKDSTSIYYNGRKEMSGVAKAPFVQPDLGTVTSDSLELTKSRQNPTIAIRNSKKSSRVTPTEEAGTARSEAFDFEDNATISKPNPAVLDARISGQNNVFVDSKEALEISCPRKITPTNSEVKHSKQISSFATRMFGSSERPSVTPTEQAVVTKSAVFDFEDDFEISESDLLALDAAIVATQGVSDELDQSTNPVKLANKSTKLQDNLLLLKQKSNAAKNQKRRITEMPRNSLNYQNLDAPKCSNVPSIESGGKDNTDEFGHFDFDFEDLDKKIQKHTPKELSTNAPTKTCSGSPEKDHFFDDIDENFDFQALDNQIAQLQSLGKKGFTTDTKRKVAAVNIQLPLPNAKVSNPRSMNDDKRQTFCSFSRYKIISVHDDTTLYTKALMVKSWKNEMTNIEQNRKDSLHRPGIAHGKLTSIQNMEEEKDGDGWIFLRGEWYHTPAQPQDIIHLCSVSGRYKTNSEALPVILHTCAPTGSDEKDDLVLVLHPDMLIPPTIISEAISCSRRAVLRSRLGSSGLNSAAALYGIMRHNLFELCMSENDFSAEFAKDSIFLIVRKAAENLVSLGIKDEEARNEVLRVLPQLQKFHRDFMRSQEQGFCKSAMLNGNGIHNDIDCNIDSVEGTEEDLWSHEFGLKGNLDVTVKATTQEVTSQGQRKGEKDKGIIGIELKTGHSQQPQSAHIAQLALYILMLSVRYGLGSPSDDHASKVGMLLYMNPHGLSANRVSPLINEWKSLIGQRNAIACDIKNATGIRGVSISNEEGKDSSERLPNVRIDAAPPTNLPDVLQATQQCNHCYVNRECMLYASSGNKEKLSLIKKSHAKLIAHFCGHLDQQDIQYFLDWDRLIDLEADATAKAVTALWLTPSLDLELKTGRTVSSLVLEVPVSRGTSMGGNEDFEWVLVFLKRASDSVSKAEFSRLAVERGSHVVISYDSTSTQTSFGEQCRRLKVVKNTMYLARGIVSSLDGERIAVKISKQHCRQLMQAYDKEKLRRDELKLRIDTDDVQTGLGTTKQNLINLFTGDVKPFENSKADPKLSQNYFVRNRFAKLREKIVRLDPPQYDKKKLSEIFNDNLKTKIPGCEMKILRDEFELLNSDQKAAVKKVMTANDYTLIQGLPGTGKTSTIVFVARLLAAHGKRVLVTSYTHAAVDNIMIKLIDKGVGNPVNPKRLLRSLVRIGRKGTIHPAVEPILLSEVALTMQELIDGEAEKSCKAIMPSAGVIQATISNARIVGVTALSIPRSPILVSQKFDIVIIDEAGQINQPAILGALMAADNFVLVGDHKQLPPLVTSELAENAGYGISMLSRLAEKHPECVAQLTLQYRMHEDICRICNDIAYNGKLKCANEKVRTSLLQLNHFEASKVKLDRWVSRIINPKLPVVFADTDFYEQDDSKQLYALESKAGKGGVGNMVNDREVVIVRRIIDALLESGLPASSIGLISPFRAQVRKLTDSTAIAHWQKSGLEISTIDRYQGRDKQVIIVSFVRSNQQGYAGRLLNDYRRLNVAVSRAMKKLVMVGSYSTLHSGSTVLRPVLDGLLQRKQVEVIPQHVLRSPIYE